MSGFTVVETQEQFDEAIKERLERERRTVEKKYEGFLSPDDIAEKYEGYVSPSDMKKKYEGYLSPDDFENKKGEYEKKLQKYESDSVKTRIAKEAGIPYEATGFLQGEDEESLKKSADALKEIIGKTGAPPLAKNDSSEIGDKDAALKKTLQKLKGED